MLHDLSYEGKHRKQWVSCTFFFLPESVTKAHNHSDLVLLFKELVVMLLTDSADMNRAEMLLCPVGAVRCYWSKTEQYCLNYSNLFTL